MEVKSYGSTTLVRQEKMDNDDHGRSPVRIFVFLCFPLNKR